MTERRYILPPPAGFADESNQPPDLQEWIARYGCYQNIPWDAWDRAHAKYQARYRRKPA
jgi:hypothetical protein